MPNQIYSIVNSVVGQAIGSNALTVVDENGLIALGNAVLSSTTTTENFINTLVQRIGKTVLSYRKYKSMFDDLMISDMEYGNIVQKIKVSMPSAESDESYNLTNGVAVDMYKVAKPKTTQKLFTTETPYQIHVTIQKKHLKERFLSESAMSGFISQIFTEIQNAIEMSLETLGRNCLNNMIAECSTTATRFINVLDKYNTETNNSLTVATAKNNPEFLRYCVGLIKLYSRKMTAMTSVFNDGTETRHTPYEMQKLYVLADYETKFETVVQYRAFNKEFVSLNGFKEIPFWQSIETPEKINVKRSSDGTVVTTDNIIACLFDRESIGTYKHDEDVATTPFNARGLYSNTYWHLRDIWFNDVSENFVVFYMAEV